MMMHKVFKVARVMGPSVIFIDECEKARGALCPAALTVRACRQSSLPTTPCSTRPRVSGHDAELLFLLRSLAQIFISDKKKCGAGIEPYNRIRKDLGKEVDVRTPASSRRSL